MERKLSAIVSVDLVGYSRLTDLDERGTHARVRALLDALNELITKHGGKTIKNTGDGALVTFDSVVHAVECAMEAQAELVQRPDEAPESLKLKLRIGVNVGDIILDGGDVYGQGVNLAVRLQEIAKSGSVYVSRAVVDYAQGKAAARFIPVGKMSLKNIIDPVEIFEAVAGAPGSVLRPMPRKAARIHEAARRRGRLPHRARAGDRVLLVSESGRQSAGQSCRDHAGAAP